MGAPATLPVIVNRGGGGASGAGDALQARLRAAFALADCPIVLELVEGGDLSAAVARHASAPRIVVGGGDGTLRAAAQVLLESGAELAILPLGTRNHFARQLGVPPGLEEAAALAATGTSIAVDMGEANGRVFLNNASLGAYVELVRKRDASGLPKLLGSLIAGTDILRRLHPRRYDLALDGAKRSIETVQLFIGNNHYEVEQGKPGERRSLHDARLSVLATAPITRVGLLRAAYRVARGKADIKQDFAIDADVRELRIEGEGAIGIALDGEDMHLSLPLVLRSMPRALKVVAPG